MFANDGVLQKEVTLGDLWFVNLSMIFLVK